MAGVLVEVWTGELVKAINSAMSGSFLDGIADNSQLVDNDTIHLVDVGVDPDVLVNNTTYPIPLQNIDDTDIAIRLDKFTTKTTPVTDDELYALSYDKIELRKKGHADALIKERMAKALHSLAPNGTTNVAKNPILRTSGPTVDGRKTLIPKDLIRLKKAYNKLGVSQDLRLVLSTDHENDLLQSDQKFADQYYKYATGEIVPMYGFEISSHVATPVFTSAGLKSSYGALETATNFRASICFYKPFVFKATGTTKMFYSKAENDTEYHRNKMNFEQRFIAMPKKLELMGAIISDLG